MKKSRRSPWRLLYKFHRYTGLLIGIFVILLAITGIILNHTEELSLDQKYIQSPAILDWYGIAVPEVKKGFAIQRFWLSQLEQQVYLGAIPVFKTPQSLIGVVANSDFITAAFTDSLLLLTLEGGVIERISKPAIERVGMTKGGRIYIKSQGNIYYSDDQLLSWELAQTFPGSWSSSVWLPSDLQEQLKAKSRHNILPYERVMLDIHSGRFFGTYGVYFIDFASVLFIFLVISGVWIWLRHK